MSSITDVLAKSINLNTPSVFQNIPWWTVAAAFIIGLGGIAFWKTTLGKIVIVGAVAFIFGMIYVRGGVHR